MQKAPVSGFDDKLGGEPDLSFEIRNIQTADPVDFFIPVSECNNIRREAVEQLTAEREKNRPRLTPASRSSDAVYPSRSLDFTGNVLNRLSEQFYKKHGVLSIEKAAESGRSMKNTKVMRTRYCIGYEKKWCGTPEASLDHFLEDDNGNRFRFECTCDDCGMDLFLT